MKSLIYKGYTASFELDLEKCIVRGKIDSIPEIIEFTSSNIGDLKELFVDAVERYLDDCREKGFEPFKPCSGNVQFRVPRSLHAAALKVAKLKYPSFNKFGEEILRAAVSEEFPQFSRRAELDGTNERFS